MANAQIRFPPVSRADPNGLLAVGGELSPEQVFAAHSQGIFPWFEDDRMILWWAPDPRAVLPTDQVHLSRSLKKQIRQSYYTITLDQNFAGVIENCARLRKESWITPAINRVYCELHQQQRAHSCELWDGDILIGGLYGVCLNRVFCGESMFSCAPSASKIVLWWLCQYLYNQGVTHLDTQFLTPHLQTMGAITLPRVHYMQLLDGNPDRLRGSWHFTDSIFPVDWL